MSQMSSGVPQSATSDFIPVTDRLIYNPSLKVRMSVLGSKEIDDPQCSLHIEYDPEIRRDNLLELLSPERRAFLRTIPALAPTADEPKPFISPRSERIASLLWIPEKRGTTLTARFVEDMYSYRLIEADIRRRNLPALSEHPSAFLLDAIRASIPLFPTAILNDARGADTVVYAKADVAREFFDISGSVTSVDFQGFVCIL